MEQDGGKFCLEAVAAAPVGRLLGKPGMQVRTVLRGETLPAERDAMDGGRLQILEGMGREG